MSHTFGTSARLPATATTTTANPATFTINCPAGTTVLWLGIVVSGTTARAGGDPTYNSVSMTAGSAKTNAGGTPETCAETWYMLNPPTGSSLTISVPNSDGRAMTMNAACASAASGFGSRLVGSVQTPGNSTNPSTTSSTGAIGDIWFAVIGDGATTWNPTGRSGTQINDWDAGSRGHGAQYRIATATTGETVSWTFGTSEDWIIEVDRFGEVRTSRGALSSGSASVSGTAERAVTGTGALSSAAAAIGGAAERVVTSSGALTAQSAAVAGTASIPANRTSSGALVAQNAAVAGTAERTLTSTGTLTAQSAAVAGTTEREVKAAGALAADIVTLAGSAVRIVTSTGALASGESTLVGIAATVGTSLDLRVSWAEFDTGAVPLDVRVSWAEFDTGATPLDLRVSWVEFDTGQVPASDARSAWLRTLFSIEGFADACREARRGAADVLLAREMLEQAKGPQIRLPAKKSPTSPRKKREPLAELAAPQVVPRLEARAPEPLFKGLEQYLLEVRAYCLTVEQHKEQQFVKRRRRIHAAALLLA